MAELKKTQRERVVDYIAEFGSITALEAIRDIGCYRLASRVSELRKLGYPIITEPEKVLNRYGGTSRIARYRMEVGSDGGV